MKGGEKGDLQLVACCGSSFRAELQLKGLFVRPTKEQACGPRVGYFSAGVGEGIPNLRASGCDLPYLDVQRYSSYKGNGTVSL